MARETVDKRITYAWDVYVHTVEAVAIALFIEKVRPWLEKKGYCFRSGNGAYYIGRYTPGRGFSNSDWMYVDPDTLPKWLYDLLEMETPGLRGNSLGTLMPDYDPPLEGDKK